MTPVCSHDSLAEKEIPKECSHHQVLPKQPLKQRPRQTVPGNGIRDCSENPVEFAERRASLLELTGDLACSVHANLHGKWILENKEAHCNLNWRCKTASEQVCRNLWIHRQSLLGGTGSELDTVLVRGDRSIRIFQPCLGIFRFMLF